MEFTKKGKMSLERSFITELEQGAFMKKDRAPVQGEQSSKTRYYPTTPLLAFYRPYHRNWAGTLDKLVSPVGQNRRWPGSTS